MPTCMNEITLEYDNLMSHIYSVLLIMKNKNKLLVKPVALTVVDTDVFSLLVVGVM